MSHTSPLTVDAIHVSESDDVWRVSADVDGQPLWFSSADVALRPAPEAFASALLMPALAARRRLEIATPVCPRYLAAVPAVLRLFHEWYGYPEIAPVLRARPGQGEGGRGRVGLCFSGGVDSLFSLLRHRPPVDTLVYVYDYDIPIRGHDRAPQYEPWLRRLAEEAGLRAVMVRTNLKRHPLFRHVDWRAAHGACLAAVGHLLSDSIGTLVLSSSYHRSDPHPSGTHWKLDPLWSSNALKCVHFGDTHTRTQKLGEIAGEPLVQAYLRPCWENLDDRQNCGQCEKCLRTQLVLLRCGELGRYTVFRHELPLAERIARLRRISTLDLVEVHEKYIREGLPLSVEQAAIDLVRRSRRWLAKRQRKQAIRRAVGRLWGGIAQPETQSHST